MVPDHNNGGVNRGAKRSALNRRPGFEARQSITERLTMPVGTVLDHRGLMPERTKTPIDAAEQRVIIMTELAPNDVEATGSPRSSEASRAQQ